MQRHASSLTVLAALAAFSGLSPALAAAESASARGLDHFYNLEYDEAANSFRAAIAADPQGLEAYNHLAQTILYRAMFRSGLLESALITGDDVLTSVFRLPKLALGVEEEREFNASISTAMRLAKARLERAPGDTAALFALGSAHGLRANYSVFVRKAWLDALRDGNAARQLHNRAAQLEPANVDARMMQAINDYVVATLPAGFRFLAAIVGIRGDRQRGLDTLAEVAAHGRRNREDARILLATIYRHEKMARQSARLVDQLQADYPRNYLFGFARIFTVLDAGDSAAAWSALREVEELSAAAAPGYAHIHPAKLLYARGFIQMRSGDLGAASATLARAASVSGPEERLTRVRSLVRLGQIHDLRGERDLAREAYRTVVAAAPGTRCSRESREYLSHPYRAGESD